MTDTAQQLMKILEPEQVSNDEDLLTSYSGKHSPQLVVFPENTDDVAKVVKWANSTGTPLVPVSSTRPSTKGGSLPKVKQSVIVDLSKMNRILRIDTKNRVVMIEPGVRFPELIRELKEHGLRPLMPFIPRPGKSVVGSCLDRNAILTPRFHWDISDPLLCTETVFGNGDIFRTGSAAGPGTLEEQWASGQSQKNPMDAQRKTTQT